MNRTAKWISRNPHTFTLICVIAVLISGPVAIRQRNVFGDIFFVLTLLLCFGHPSFISIADYLAVKDQK